MRTIYTYILGLGIVTLTFLNIKSCTEKRKLEKLLVEAESKPVKVKTETTIVDRYIDRFGSAHAVIKATENTYKEKSAISSGLLDSVLLKINGQKKEIEELTRIKATLLAKNLQAVETIDSLTGAKHYSYSDKYVNISYNPTVDTNKFKHGSFDFTYNADLQIAQYWRRKWILANKVHYIDIWSDDPRLTIRGVERFRIKPQEPLADLRIQLASSYHPEFNSFSIGTGVMMDIGRFNTRVNYLYNPDTDKWNPSFNLNYDVIKF